MRFPSDKDKRNKILMGIGIAVAAIGYGVYTFGVKPMVAKRQVAYARISELEDLLWRGRKDINMINHHRRQNCETLSDILEFSETKRQILRPNLGNYLLVATDFVGQHAERLGLKIAAINQMTPSDRKLVAGAKSNPKGPRFRAYTVNVRLSAGLSDLALLVGALERENPYLCISRLGVIGNAKTPEQHKISFDVQWPIWIDASHPMQLAVERLTDEERL
jgi:hypothetical protein